MIKYWQSMLRLHSELWLPWQKLRLFDTDRAMDFLEPFYPPMGRPATNRPQILRSFVLFSLLFSMGLTPSSLTHWVERLKHDRVLATLVGCTLHSLPPLGSYYDLMNRLWTAPKTDLYGRGKLLPASWNSKKPDRPKGKGQKASELHPKITEKLALRISDGRDIPFNFEARLQQLFYFVAVLPSAQKSAMSGQDLSDASRHFPDPDASWGWDSDLDKHYFGYTLFQLSCHNSDLHTDISLLLRLPVPSVTIQ